MTATNAVATDLRYPIGRFTWPESVSADQRAQWTAAIERAPMEVRAAVAGLTQAQIDTQYRPGGWTVRQVAHHVPDSHLNAYIRFKLALTEDEPTIKPYDEARWAELSDTRTVPLDVSLDLLDALHERWVALIRGMSDEDMKRRFVHPDHNRSLRLDQVLGLYAWHGRHHTAHIRALREREGW
jgi:hypothetical protein